MRDMKNVCSVSNVGKVLTCNVVVANGGDGLLQVGHGWRRWRDGGSRLMSAVRTARHLCFVLVSGTALLLRTLPLTALDRDRSIYRVWGVKTPGRRAILAPSNGGLEDRLSCFPRGKMKFPQRLEVAFKLGSIGRWFRVFLYDALRHSYASIFSAEKIYNAKKKDLTS